MASQSLSDLDSVDDFYLSLLFSNEEEEKQQQQDMQIIPVSDAKYAEELQLQEALMGAVIISQLKNNNPSSTVEPSSSSAAPPPPKEIGESSVNFCEICAEKKETDQMFATDDCVHSFCSDCISKHVAAKIQDSISKVITCPGLNCRAVLELDNCRPKLSKGVIDLWAEALCEQLISPSQKFYCPFRDCAAMMLDDNGGGEEVIREAECPFCHRLFCARCYVPWHSGVECEVFQTLNEDERGREDLMVMELAKQQKSSRCPQCKFYVERTEGCPHMSCRCGFQFCYGCGMEWTTSHGGCQRN